MFGFLSKKHYSFKCPICEYEYGFDLDPKEITDFDYEFSPTYKNTEKLADSKCEFCKAEFVVLMTENQTVFAVDEKWEMHRQEYDNKYESIEEKITEIEDSAYDEETDKEIPLNEAQQKKIDKLKSQLDRIEESFENKEEKYNDKQYRWQEKLENRK